MVEGHADPVQSYLDHLAEVTIHVVAAATHTHTHNTTFLQNNLSARDFVSRSSHSVTGGDLGILHPEQSLAAVHTSEVIR